MRRSLLVTVGALLVLSLSSRAYGQEDDMFEETDEDQRVQAPDSTSTTIEVDGDHIPMQDQPEMTEQQRQQQEFIMHLLTSISETCNQQLQVVLQTPPEEQRRDQLTDECQKEVQVAADDFRRQKGIPTSPQGGDEGAETPQGETAKPPVNDNTTTIVAQVLLIVLLPILAFFGIAFKRHLDEKAAYDKLTPAEKEELKRKQEEAEEKRRRKEAKRVRQGRKPTADTE